MKRLMIAVGLGAALLSYGCSTVATTTTRAELKSVQKAGDARPSVEGSLVIECRWAGVAAGKDAR